MGSESGEKDLFERRFQMVLGGLMWAGMLYFDLGSDVRLSDLATRELMIKGVLYGFAGILIKGFTTSEIIDLVRAVRGK